VNDPRGHHTVPQLHLRRFANDRDQVRVVDRNDMARTFLASVENVTVERDFYAVETESGELSQEVERLLARLESDAAGAIERVVGGAFPANEEDRGHISVFIAAQWLRGWDMREALRIPMAHSAQMIVMNTTKASLREFFRETEGRDAPDEELEDLVAFARDPSRYRIEVHPNQIIRQMLNVIPGLANLAFARKWQLLHARDGSFLTSDAPVSTWTHPNNYHPFYSAGGFGMSDELALPLDRRFALVLAHDPPSGEVLREVSGRHVREQNLRTAASGRRYIIHHPDDEPLLGLEIPPSRPKMSVSQPPWRMVPEDE